MDKTQDLGKALKAAESVGQVETDEKEKPGPGSAIGLNAEQQEVSWLMGLNSAVQAALDQPDPQRLKEANEALKSAAVQFEKYQNAKEDSAKQREKIAQKENHRKIIQNAHEQAKAEETELQTKEDRNKNAEGRERKEKTAWSAKAQAQKNALAVKAAESAAQGLRAGAD